MANPENSQGSLEITRSGINAQGKEAIAGKWNQSYAMIEARLKAQRENDVPFVQTTREIILEQKIVKTDIPRINLNQGALRTQKRVQQITPELQTTRLSHLPKPVPSNLEWNLKPLSPPPTGKDYQ